MNIPCFLIEPTGRQELFLRRYVSSDPGKCTGRYSYHNGMTSIGQAHEKRDAKGNLESVPLTAYLDDPRWPVKCDHCDYVFGPMDEFQVYRETIYRRADNGQEMTLKEAPVGAIWDATWLHGHARWTGADGRAWHCRLPGGHDWHIDGTASNCDSPCKNCGQPMARHNQAAPVAGQPNAANCVRFEDAHPHKCWVRTGTPPQLDVGKGAPGESCNAGAGSIVVPGWHGFLRNGVLIPC